MAITLTKIPNGIAQPATVSQPCAWCYNTATLMITVPGEWTSSVWTDPACEKHAVEHFGASIVTAGERCGNCGGRGCACDQPGKGWNV